MMEAMQMGPALYGPQFVGPGIGSVGSCVFDAQIGRSAYSRITKDNQKVAERAMVVDAATAFSEQKGEIGHYKLLVRNTPYRDKITDEIVNEKTLVSPDFNFEAAGVWTSAGEDGTVGTIGEYRATVERANELAQTDGDASMFWVSPSAEGEMHRAYLWVKTGDEVEAFQYIVPGSKDAVSTMMKKLGYQDSDGKPLEDQTIIRLGNEPKIHHKDVFDAVVLSLSSGELEKAKPILDKFRQEVELPDSFRKQRLKNYQVEYEAKLNSEILKKAYENDIGKWLKSVIQGFAAINRIDSNGEIRESRVYDGRIVGDQLKIDKAAYPDYQRLKNIKVLQPIIPGIIGLAGILADSNMEIEKGLEYTFPDTTLPLREACDEAIPLSGIATLSASWRITRDDNLSVKARYYDSSSEPIFWQEFISAIFEPLPDSENWVNREINSITIEAIPLEDNAEFFKEERNFQEALMQLFPMLNADRENEPKPSQNKEGLPVLTTGLQQGLEVIAAIIQSEENIGLIAGQKEEKTRQHKVEIKVADIAEEIIVKMFKDVQIPQNDAFSQLAFLLHVYNNTNSSDEIKQLIVAVIYRQIEAFYEDRQTQVLHPELSVLFTKFAKLSKNTSFLERRFNLILEALSKPDVIARNDNLDSLQDLISWIIFVILKNSQKQTSAERLPQRNIFMTTYNLFPPQSKQKKSGVIYQYSSLLVRQGGL